MAITYSYPQLKPKASDLLVGTSLGEMKDVTANFSVGEILGLAKGGWTRKDVVFGPTELQSLSQSNPLYILPDLPVGEVYNIQQVAVWWEPGTQVYNFGQAGAIDVTQGVSDGLQFIAAGTTVTGVTSQTQIEINPATSNAQGFGMDAFHSMTFTRADGTTFTRTSGALVIPNGSTTLTLAAPAVSYYSLLFDGSGYNQMFTGDQMNASINNSLKKAGQFYPGITDGNLGVRFVMDGNYAQATQGNGNLYISISYKITKFGSGIQAG